MTTRTISSSSGPIKVIPTPSGRYVAPPGNVTSTGFIAQNQREYAPLLIPRSLTIDRIGLEVTTLVASGTIRLGIYTDVDDLPANLLLDAGTIPSTSTGIKEIIISQDLSPGRYWLCAVEQTAHGCSIKTQRSSVSGGYSTLASGVSSFTGSFLDSLNNTTGALPATASPSSGSEDHPRILVRIV